MNLQTDSKSHNPHIEECMKMHSCWGWFLALGVLLILAGMMAIASNFVATMATILLFGWLLVFGGVVQVVNAFVARTWRGFGLHLAAGALHLVVGGLMVNKPVAAASAITLMLAIAFLVGGIMRIVAAIANSFPGRGWVLLNGAITLFLGVSIWQEWPESSLWVIGLFVGIDLIFNGWTWVMLGLIVRNDGKAQTVAK